MTWHKYSAICSKLIWLGFVIGSTLIKSGETRSLHVKLPGYQKNLSVFPATSCPANYSEYIAAATEYGCTLQDLVLTNKYHCMPNVDFTLLVQFCYPVISPPTQKSYCWVLSYSGIIDQRKCNNFVDGCPVEHYRSFDMYKYPQCSNISTSDRCYVADAKCTPRDQSSTTNHRYFISNIQEYVTTDTATTEATEKSSEESFSLVGVILGTLFGAVVFVVLVCLILYNRNRNRKENTRPNLTKQDFSNYLQEGKLTVNKVTQCQIVGEDGVGKTTLVYRLRKRFDARNEITPTRGCSYHENVLVFKNGKLRDPKDSSSKIKLLQTSVDTVQMFTESKKYLREGEVTSSETAALQENKRDQTAASHTARSETTEEEKETSDLHDRPKVSEIWCSNENETGQTSASDTARSEITEAENKKTYIQESDPLLEKGESRKNRSHSNMDLEMASMSDIMHQEDPSILSDLPKTKDEIPKVLSILDFAGQGGYYASHPIHLRKNAIFILVVNILHFNAKDKIRTEEDLEMNEGHLLCDRPGTAYSKWSHEDFYLYWLRNIHYFCGKDVPVITVATHTENSTEMGEHATMMRVESKEYDLHVAVRKGDDMKVDKLLKGNVNINEVDENSQSPLFIASAHGFDSIVETLLDKGADTNLCTKQNESPLFIAAHHGNGDAVKLLLSHGAIINLCKNDGTSPLFDACQENFPSVVKILLAHDAEVNHRRNGGASSLFTASSRGNTEIVKLLVDKHADVNLCTDDHRSPLLMACSKGYEMIVKVLLNAGADVNICKTSGSSALNRACREEHYKIVELLIANNADANIQKHDGTTPLMTAVKKGNESITRFLLQNGADDQLCTNDGNFPLFVASVNGHAGIVELLLKRNPIVWYDVGERNPLEIARENGHKDVVALFEKKIHPV